MCKIRLTKTNTYGNIIVQIKKGGQKTWVKFVLVIAVVGVQF